MSDRIWTPTSTLGDIADALRPMKDGGVTRDSMLFVIDKVWFEAAQEEADRTKAEAERDEWKSQHEALRADVESYENAERQAGYWAIADDLKREILDRDTQRGAR